MNLASLLTLGVVLVGYWQVSLQTQTPGLRKSALGLFGMLIIMELASLNITEGDLHCFAALVVLVMVNQVTGSWMVLVSG